MTFMKWLSIGELVFSVVRSPSQFSFVVLVLFFLVQACCFFIAKQNNTTQLSFA